MRCTNILTRCALAFSALIVTPVSAVTRISLGYGLQVNSMFNAVLSENTNRLLLNSAAASVIGQSAGTDYQTRWSAALAETATPYLLVNLPELRMSSDWESGANTWGIFTSLSGIVPQTSLYYAGGYQLTESKTCAGVDYPNCPLAALNFVSSSGIGTYDIELRTSLRLYSLTGGISWGRSLEQAWGGSLAFAAELGFHLQSFTAYSQFAAVRCANGATLPCAQNAQVRSVQGELNMQALFAAGPHVGALLRYERPQDRWFAELGISAVFLFTRLKAAGYTNFVAAGTVAFTQTAHTLGIEADRNFFAILPVLSIRAGMRL